jgi:hypothetical protein
VRYHRSRELVKNKICWGQVQFIWCTYISIKHVLKSCIEGGLISMVEWLCCFFPSLLFSLYTTVWQTQVLHDIMALNFFANLLLDLYIQQCGKHNFFMYSVHENAQNGFPICCPSLFQHQEQICGSFFDFEWSSSSISVDMLLSMTMYLSLICISLECSLCKNHA